jgi:hypothetical protein
MLKKTVELNHSSQITENTQVISKYLGHDVSEEESSEQVKNLLNFLFIMLAIMDKEYNEEVD